MDGTDASGPSAALPDLTIGDFSVGQGLSSDEAAFKLCIQGKSEFVAIQNRGGSDSGPYRVALGLLDYDMSKAVGGCALEVPAGTPAGATTQLTDHGCCDFDPKLLVDGRQYVIMLLADVDEQVMESDETNNISASPPFPFVSAP